MAGNQQEDGELKKLLEKLDLEMENNLSENSGLGFGVNNNDFAISEPTVENDFTETTILGTMPTLQNVDHGVSEIDKCASDNEAEENDNVHTPTPGSPLKLVERFFENPAATIEGFCFKPMEVTTSGSKLYEVDQEGQFCKPKVATQVARKDLNLVKKDADICFEQTINPENSPADKNDSVIPTSAEATYDIEFPKLGTRPTWNRKRSYSMSHGSEEESQSPTCNRVGDCDDPPFVFNKLSTQRVHLQRKMIVSFQLVLKRLMISNFQN
jgi:hypothetical protein